MTVSSNVAIFWDYENCALPAAEPSYAIVNKIRRLAHQYGSVKTFRAYLEYPEQSSLKSVSMRSELQSCGVSLIDCPHNGRKDVADKMMMIDMMAYAIDNPAPATIILISGDRDFVYAVSILSLRQYKIVLLAPKATYGGLKAQADAVYNWPEDFLPEPPVAVHPTATHVLSGHEGRQNRAASTSLSEAWQNQLPTPPTGSATPQPPNRDINPTSNAGDTFNGSTSGSTVDDARGRTTPAISGPINAPQPKRITESLSRTATPAPSSRSRSPVSFPGTKESAIAPSIKSVKSRPPSPHPRALAAASPTLSVAQSSAPIAGNSSRFASTSSNSAHHSPYAANTTAVASSTYSQPTYSQRPTTPASNYARLRDTDCAADGSPVWQQTYTHTQAYTAPTSPAHPPAHVPYAFRPLVRALKRQLAAGVVRVESSQLGTLLAEEARVTPAAVVYERAGVSRLKEYTALAAERALVTLSRESVDGHYYVALHPAYRTNPAEYGRG